MRFGTQIRISTVLMSCFITPEARAQPAPEVRIRNGPYAPPGAVISVQSNLVEMTATVRDRNGRLAGGFQREDFELSDDGKPRTISVFAEQRASRANAPAPPNASDASAVAQEAPAPRAIALFFDDTHIAAFGLNGAKIAARKLVSTGLHPGDRLAIFTDSGDVTLDLTSDSAALAAAIDRVKPHPQRAVKGVAVCPTLTPYEAFAIANHLDFKALQIAVAEKIACDCLTDDPDCPKRQPAAVQEIAATQWNAFRYQSTVPLDVLKIVIRALSHAPGQRILLMVSPGFATGGMDRQTAAIADDAVRAHVTINALDSEGLMGAAESPDPRADQSVRKAQIASLMSDAAAATGGRFIHNRNDIASAMDSLTSAPEISYTIGFAPSGEPDGKRHALKLRLKNGSGYQIESRPSYFSAPPEKQSESVQDRIDRIAETGETIPEFPIAVRVSPDGDGNVHVEISLDAHGLKFPKKEGRSVQQVTFVTLLEDAAGNYIAGKQAVMDLALTAATLAGLEKDGIHAATSFVAPSGSYRIREIVREAVDNRIAASNTIYYAK